MTYTDSEKSKHSGKPLELYRYAGTYQTFRYTSSPVPVSFQAPDEAEPFVYTPMATRRSAVQHTTQNDDTSEVTIDLPVTSDLVAIYGFQISPPDLYLTIFRGHNPGEFVRYWQGNVENISVVRGTATVRVPSPLASALSAEFPTVYFQTPCNHTLFDAGCQIDPEDWTVTTAIVSAVNTTIEVTPASVGALDGQLIGGDAVLASGERRMIVAQVDDTITVNYPFASANEDDELVLLTGCDLALMGDCKTRYDNTINHGGFGFIPSKNIFQTGLEPGKDVTDESCLPPIYEGWDHEWSFEVIDNDGGGAPSLSFLTMTYPDATVVNWNNATGPADDVFSRETEQVSDSHWVQRWKMRKLSVNGDYEVTFDPTNFPGNQTYNVYYRRWDETSLSPPVGSTTSASGFAQDIPFTL